MDPNSTHQTWSAWTYQVQPDLTHPVPSMDVVRDTCARFARRVMGSPTQMRVTYRPDGHGTWAWRVDLLSEGHPVQDPAYVSMVHQLWHRFLLAGFGARSRVQATAALRAGPRPDGQPPDQMILMPGALALHPTDDPR